MLDTKKAPQRDGAEDLRGIPTLRGGALSAADELVGNLTARLQALDLWENTVFVFLSDNGGDPTVGANAPFKGCKPTLFEGAR